MKKYELTVVRFEEEDVICTSNGEPSPHRSVLPAPEELFQESNP